MKKFLTFTAVLALGLAGYALWVSLQVEAANLDLVARVESRADVRVIESRFDRGWLRSYAETHFEFRGAVGAAFQAPLEWAGRIDVRKRVGFVVSQEIEHGPLALWGWLNTGAQGSPVLATVDGTITMDQEAHSEIAAAFGKLPSARVRLQVRANGDLTGPISMQPVPLEPRDVEAGKAPRWVGRFGGLHGQVGLAANQLAVSLTSAGVDLKGADFELDLDGWSAEWRQDLSTEAEVPAQHALESLMVHFPVAGQPDAGRRLAIRGVKWKATPDPDQLAVSATSESATVDRLALRGVRLAAAWPRDPAVVPAEEAITSANVGFLPELEIESLEGHLIEGPMLISGRLHWLSPETESAVLDEEAPEDAVASSLVGDLDVRFPERWAGSLFSDDTERFRALLAGGQIARDGSRLRSRLMWNESGWLANGLPVETEGWLEAIFPAQPETPLAPAASPVAATDDADEVSSEAIAEQANPAALATETRETVTAAPTEPAAAPPASPAP